MPTVVVDQEQCDVNTLPHKCPRCQRSIQPIQHGSGVEVRVDPYYSKFCVPFRCPGCRWLFFANYISNSTTATLLSTAPLEHSKESFGLIDTLSPQFALVFNQASSAEAYGLDQIAGLAYRKALEFLIKDYCISKEPSAAETIKSSFLGNVIRDRVKDRKIQGAAEKVAWLGNDEAHYIRKWENHDIAALKALLRLTVSGISEDLEYDSLMASFAPKTKP